MDDFDVSKCFQTKPSRDLTMKFSIENLSTIQENFSTFKGVFFILIYKLFLDFCVAIATYHKALPRY